MVSLRRLWTTAFLIAFLPVPPAQAAHPQTILVSLHDARLRLSPYPLARWQTALQEIERDRLRAKRCLDEAPCRDIVAKPLADLVTRFSSLSGRRLLSAVNRHYNAFPYIPDQVAGKPSDDWESPLTFLQRSGDCEDYAIAKYLTLGLLGVPETEMAILIMREPVRGIDHAVLLVEDDGRLLVLDNLRGLARFESYGDYLPLYVLTDTASWRIKAAPHASTTQPASFE
jgi:predicted transglutaminase-like cysteine proteinase